MSKLNDKLGSLGQSTALRMGFGPAQTRQKTPVMLVIGIGNKGSEQAVDALLLPAEGNGRTATAAPDGVGLWGAAICKASNEDLDALKKAGADFLLIESNDAPGAALRDEDMAHGYLHPGELTDGQARAIEDSAFDFVLLRSPDVTWPLTVGSVLALQERVSAHSKHIFLQVPAVPSHTDLELLRDMPVSAIVLDLSTVPEEEVAKLHSEIAGLEPRKHRHEHSALLPASAGSGGGRRQDPDEGDDDDDDDEWEDE